MVFSVDKMMEHAFVITVEDANYGRFCRRFELAGFDRMPVQYNGILPQCLIGIDIHHIVCMNNFSIINMAKSLGWDCVTIFEYDAYPMIGCRSELDRVFAEGIPDDAGVITYGNLTFIKDWTNKGKGHHCLVNIDKTGHFGKIKDNLYGAHAVTYFASGYDEWLNSYRAKRGGDCNCDFYNQLSRHAYATTRSYFLQVKEIMQYQTWYVDPQWFSEFPPAGEFPNMIIQ